MTSTIFKWLLKPVFIIKNTFKNENPTNHTFKSKKIKCWVHGSNWGDIPSPSQMLISQWFNCIEIEPFKKKNAGGLKQTATVAIGAITSFYLLCTMIEFQNFWQFLYFKK